MCISRIYLLNTKSADLLTPVKRSSSQSCFLLIVINIHGIGNMPQANNPNKCDDIIEQYVMCFDGIAALLNPTPPSKKNSRKKSPRGVWRWRTTLSISRYWSSILRDSNLSYLFGALSGTAYSYRLGKGSINDTEAQEGPGLRINWLLWGRVWGRLMIECVVENVECFGGSAWALQTCDSLNRVNLAFFQAVNSAHAPLRVIGILLVWKMSCRWNRKRQI